MAEGRYVLELPLHDPGSYAERIMLGRLEIARFAYNQFVTELLRRDKLMRESKEYQRLSAENRASKKDLRSTNPAVLIFKTKKERSDAWRELRNRFDLHGEFCLDQYVKEIAADLKPRTGKNALPTTFLHEIASRAWEAYEPFLTGKRSGSGRRGAPRRRPYREPFTTISSRSTEKNGGPLRFEQGSITWSNGATRKKDKVSVSLGAIIDSEDDVVSYALATNAEGELLHPIRQLRVGYRNIRGKRRWFTQLVLEGKAYKKPLEPITEGSVGVDVGSKHIAVVAPKADYANIERLNPAVELALREGKREERRRARAQDRSKRATNPEAFDDKGRYIKGKRVNNRSKRYRALGAERQETQRVLNETKRQQTNALANRIISLGTSIRMEDLAYKSWQAANMGRSMLASTPGALTTAIKRACEKYGREFVAIDARAARLSQLCHECGQYHKDQIKGSIESRMSTCPCGREPVQRDLYSAFLASLCDARGTLDANHAREVWARTSSVLSGSGASVIQSTSSGLAPIRGGGVTANGASELIATDNRRKAHAGACEVGAEAQASVSEAMRDRGTNTRNERRGEDDLMHEHSIGMGQGFPQQRQLQGEDDGRGPASHSKPGAQETQ